ncbi:MBL fold metallo-hydrolase, partial [Kibdelosporangium lantanae]
RVQHPVTAHYPASGQQYFERLRNASSFYETATIRQEPVAHPGVLATGAFGTLESQELDHGIDAVGYRLAEPDSHRMSQEQLRARGISGPDVGRLLREGRLGDVTLDEVSVPRPGQKFAFIMDTRLCDGVFALAEGVDMLVIESTFLHEDTELAVAHGHLTAAQAARVAAESGVRQLVLTHFSQRYRDPSRFHAEAAEVFDGEIV